MARKVAENCRRSQQKIAHQPEGDSAVDRRRGFGCLFETLDGSIKTKLELGFKTPSNFTKNQSVKTINLVEFVNFGGLNYFICV